MFKRILRGSLLLALLSGLTMSAVLAEIIRYAEVDQTRPADAAIVLGAGAWGTSPSPVLRERLNHAIALYEQGLVEKLIFTGGIGRRSRLSEAEVSRRYAVARGVAEADILLDGRSTNTIENLANARTVGLRNGLETYLLVSTPYHMKRAMWIAADLDMEAFSSPTRTIRWISTATRRRAIVQETASFLVHVWRRFTPDYARVIRSESTAAPLS